MDYQAHVTTSQENIFDGWFDEQVIKIQQKVGKKPFSNEDLIFIILNQQKRGFDALSKKVDQGFAASDREFKAFREELRALREDMQKGFEKSDREIKALREDMQKGFEKSDRESKELREDMQKGFEKSDRETKELREDMQKGFEMIRQDMKEFRRDMTELRKDMHNLTIRMFTSLLAAVGLMFALLRFFPPTVGG